MNHQEEKINEQDHWNRPRDNELGRCGDGRRGTQGHHESGREPFNAIGGCRGEERGALCRPGGQTAGGHESGKHDFFDQTVYGPQVQRGTGGDQARPVQGQCGIKRRRPRKDGRPHVCPAGDFGDDPAEDAFGRGRVPRGKGGKGGRHGAGLFQRQPASGDERRGQDRRSRRGPHRQRADCGGAGLRIGQEERRNDRRV